MAGHATRHGVDGELHINALVNEQVHQLAHRTLRLGDGHPVAGNHDYLLAVRHQHRRVVRADLPDVLLALLAGGHHAAARAEGPEQDIED